MNDYEIRFNLLETSVNNQEQKILKLEEVVEMLWTRVNKLESEQGGKR